MGGVSRGAALGRRLLREHPGADPTTAPGIPAVPQGRPMLHARRSQMLHAHPYATPHTIAPDVVSTWLDHRNLSEPCTDRDPHATEVAHGNCFAAYRRICGLVHELPLNDKQRTRLHNCGDHTWVEYSPKRSAYRLRLNRCKLRICPSCGRARANKIADRLKEKLRTVPVNRISLITLTMRSTTAPLRQQLTNLRTCFKRLRRKALWTKAVRGCGVAIEVTRNTETSLWHPHLHVIADADYIPQAELATTWAKLTYGSNIVDIRRIKTMEQAVNYVAKYVGKPNHKLYEDADDALVEYATAIDKGKMTWTLGTMQFKRETPEQREERKANSDWKPVIGLPDLLRLAKQGHMDSLNILRKLRISIRHDGHQTSFRFEEPEQCRPP